MQQCLSGGFADNLENPNTVFHSATHPYEWARRCDDKTAQGVQVVENENISGSIYHHGEFDYHLYCATTGITPALNNNYNGELLSNADANSDNYISILESYNWEDTHESINYTGIHPGEDPLYSDLGNIGANTSLAYPTLLFESIVSNSAYRGIIGISKDIHVTTGNQLAFLTNSNVYLLNDSKLIVDLGAELVLGDNVKIFGNSSNNIQINGNLQTGNNLSFSNLNSGSSFGGLFLINNTLHTRLIGATFTKAKLYNYGTSLSLSSCTFNDCYLIWSYQGEVLVTNSIFTETGLYLINGTHNSSLNASMTGCTINNNNISIGIELQSFSKYLIENNDIVANGNGIHLLNCGQYNDGNQNIAENNVHNCSNEGIFVYNTYGSIAGNNIHNNRFGIKIMNNSNIALYGNASAQNQSQTQCIKDNTSWEIYCSQNCFPFYFRFNAIIDEDNLGNPSDPLVFYDRSSSSPYITCDVKYNCWGNNFNPNQDLKIINGTYSWSPTWCPGGGGIQTNQIEDLYSSAVDKSTNGEYSEAKNLFQLLIQLYPKSDYAIAAMKELLKLEAFAGSDYLSLQDYYLSNDSIINDSTLIKLGDALANQCDIELKNWQKSIDWYEDKIANPESMEDSIFAIIDLGYLYLLMENDGFKSTCVGKLTQFIPNNNENFIKHRDSLLSLLPGELISKKLQKNVDNISFGCLLQNTPNPFSKITQFLFRINKECNVSITISDIAGKEIQCINLGNCEIGIHSFNFFNNGLKSGTYFYALVLDGIKTDTKKMILLN